MGESVHEFAGGVELSAFISSFFSAQYSSVVVGALDIGYGVGSQVGLTLPPTPSQGVNA